MFSRSFGVLKRTFALPIVLYLFIALVWSLPSVRRNEEQLARDLEFSSRETLGRSPQIDSRIKVFAYDDAAAAKEFSQEGIPLRLWADVITMIAESKPSRIIFDKIFAFPEKEAENNDYFVNAVRKSGTHVVAGVFPYPRVIAPRADLSPSRPCSGTPRFEKSFVAPTFSGPATDLAPAFSHLGNTLITHLSSQFPALGTRNQTTCFAPLALADAEQIEWMPDAMRVDGMTVPLTEAYTLQPNLSSRSTYWKKTISLRAIFNRARRGERMPEIATGDTVIILPAMYTGNADFRRTPMGEMEGGFLHVALMNSRLKNEWLRSMGYGWYSYALLACAVGLMWFLTRKLTIGRAIASALVLLISLVTAALLAFSLFGIMFFWLGTFLAMMLTFVVALIERIFHLDRHKRDVKTALQGFLPTSMLEQLVQNPGSLKIEPHSIKICAMFVDIESFSMRFSGHEPETVFRLLRAQFTRISEIIHAHNGIVDRTLGDGLLAYFGYSWAVNESTSERECAEKAIRCAIAIQREWAQETVRIADRLVSDRNPSALSLATPLPVRIGINFGSAFFGDLGTGDRVDFTIVGDAVNFAKRLEDAAHSFRIMTGDSVIAAMGDTEPSFLRHESKFRWRKTLIQVKHYSELLHCWEIDPIVDLDPSLRQALRNLRDVDGRAGRQRHAWKHTEACLLLLNGATQAELVDFSPNGLCFTSNTYFARKVNLAVEIAVNRPELREQLQRRGIATFVAEVRWAAEVNGRFRHGLTLTSLNADQRHTLCDLLGASPQD